MTNGVNRHDSLFQTKICGVTSPEGAALLAAAGCHAIGLNFYKPSPRYVTPTAAREIGRGLDLFRVGVFVNETASEVTQIAVAAELDAVQLHGDEPPEFVAQITEYPIIRAFRCKDEGLTPITNYLAECKKLNAVPHTILLDAYSTSAYGGTGEVIDWNSVVDLRERIDDQIKIVLAGGLTADNVAEAIRTAQPDGVDTASGVESSPGVKDGQMVRDFVKNAKNQYDQHG